jgi:hypothetical protein
MRSYPRNSPEAAARIVAWTMLTDGHVAASELDAGGGPDVAAALGMTGETWHRVVRELCEDLLANGSHAWNATGQLHDHALSALLGEIDDPALARATLALCGRIVTADGHVTAREAFALAEVARAFDPSPRFASAAC